MALKLILVAVVGDHPSTRASSQLVLEVRATPIRSATPIHSIAFPKTTLRELCNARDALG